jgi:hypothetical protein
MMGTLPMNSLTKPIGLFCKEEGIGRQLTYNLINASEIESVLIGNRRLIIMQSWVDYISRLQQQQAGSTLGASPNPKARKNSTKLYPLRNAPASSRKRRPRQPAVAAATIGALE